MEFYPNHDDSCHLNPHNRFLLIFCPTSDVREGWGCVICRGRSFSFKFGMLIFSAIMLLGIVNDLVDIISIDEFENNKNEIFSIFLVKSVSDALIIFGILFSVFFIFNHSYCLVVIAYYLVAISFYLNTRFCIFTLTQVKKQNIITFLKKCFKGTFLTYLFWCIFDYFLLMFAWILFCNMVNLRRRQNIQNNIYNFQF